MVVTLVITVWIFIAQNMITHYSIAAHAVNESISLGFIATGYAHI